MNTGAPSGSVERTPLPEVFRDLYFDRADGVLSVEVGTGHTSEVYFDRGAPFYCKVDSPDQRLDNVLVKWGLVHPEAIGPIIQRAGGDVRGALVREGIFPDVAAFDDFMAQVLRERMVDVFAARAGQYAFSPQDVRELNRSPFPTTPADVILEGVRRMPDDASLAPLLDDDAHLLPNERPAVPFQALHLSPSEGYVLSLVTGASALSEVVAVSPLGHGQTLRLVYAMLVLDLVRHPAFAGYRFSLSELVQRTEDERAREDSERKRIVAEYDRIKGADLFAIVPGVTKAAPEQAREAVKAYQEQWRPEQFTARVAKEMRDRLLLIAGRAGEALLATVDGGKRARTEEPLEAAEPSEGDDGFRLKRMEFSKTQTQAKVEQDVQMAQDFYRRALDVMRAKDWHSAIQFLREAVRYNETSEYQAALGEALVQNPHWGKKAEEAYLRAMELDQFNARLPLALGRIYEKAGLKSRARAQYERALEIQHDFDEAKAALKGVK